MPKIETFTNFSEVNRFLFKDEEETFLLNLHPPGDADALLGTRNQTGKIDSLFAVYNTTVVIPSSPRLQDRRLIPQVLHTIQNHHVPAMVGQPRLIICPEAVRERVTYALNGQQLTVTSADIDTHYRATVDQLSINPLPSDARLHRIREADYNDMIEWVLNGRAADQTYQNALQMTTMISSRNDDYWLMEVAGKPTSIGGLNERFGDVAKISGVATAPSERGQGYARTLVGSFLQSATEKGIRHAVLIARNDPARKCYEGMGFQKRGEFARLDIALR